MRILWLTLAVTIMPFITSEDLAAFWNKLRGDPYLLDSHNRDVPQKGKLDCPDVNLLPYRGKHIRYNKGMRVARAFRAKLVRFEKAINELAREFYGREPRRLIHYGGYNCRRVRARATRISEHGLGNALDFVGLDFPPAPEGQRAQSSPPRRFSLRIKEHWQNGDGQGRHHQTFLRRLVERMEEDNLFRGIVGPPRPGHHNHFHLDYGPWSYTHL